MPLLALAVGLLAARADAKTRHCAETIVNEALIAFDDPACVTDMKSCIKAATCLAAGIEERRLCECYLQVGRRAGSYASCAALCTQHAPLFMPQNMLFLGAAAPGRPRAGRLRLQAYRGDQHHSERLEALQEGAGKVRALTVAERLWYA